MLGVRSQISAHQVAGSSSGMAAHSTPHAAPHQARGRIFSALRYRNYRLFWLGQLVSVTGTFMQGTAQQWLVLTLSSNALDLGIVGALQFGPVLVLAPFGGAIADRWPRRVILMFTQAVAGVLALALFLLTATGTVQIWQVFVLAALLGVVNAVDMPTRQAFVSEMVPADSLLNAVSLNSAQFNASRIVGPGIAGAMIALLGMPILFLLNAVSYIAVIAGLLMMRPAELMPVPHADQGRGLGRLRAMSEGARFVLTTPVVAVTFIMVTVVGIFGFNFNVLLPLEATQGLHAGPALFGLLTSSLGVGALLGALLLARRSGPPTNKLLVGMALTFGVLETGIALTRSLPAAMVLFAATGFFMSTFSAAANTRVQLSSPPELRGRVMSVYMMVFAGTTPIGNLLTSGVAGGAGVAMSFVVSGVPCVLAALVSAWLWRSPRRARVAQPAPAVAVLPLPDVADTPPMALPTLPEAVPPTRRSLPPRQPRPAPGNPVPQPRAASEAR